MNLRLGSLLAALLGLTVLQCSSDSGDSSSSVCTPGDTRVCVGPGSCKGGQACLSTGNGWGDCQCGGTGGSGSGGTTQGGAGGSGGTAQGGSGGTNAGGTGGVAVGGAAGLGGTGTGGTNTAGGAGAASSAVEACVNAINQKRQSIGAPALKRWTDGEPCAADQAQKLANGQDSPDPGPCAGSAATACPDWPGPQETMAVKCVDYIWNSETSSGKTYMASTEYTEVACGFYESASKVWSAHIYR